MADALSIRPSQIDVDDPQVSGEASRSASSRCAAALRCASRTTGTRKAPSPGSAACGTPSTPLSGLSSSPPPPLARKASISIPIVIASTTGIFPGNPVDLEQREGRVHRFKGHADPPQPRGAPGCELSAVAAGADDPWALCSTSAIRSRRRHRLIPYWIYEGSVRVERRVPMLPFSREVTRLAWLKRSLTVYRSAFGQPRQDDLLDYLQTLTGWHSRRRLGGLTLALTGNRSFLNSIAA